MRRIGHNRDMPIRPLVSRAFVLSCLLVATACTPAMVARPVVPIDRALLGVAGYGRILGTNEGGRESSYGGKAYFSRSLGWVESTLVAGADTRAGTLALGVGFRKLWSPSESVRLGVDLDGGLTYGVLGMPVAWRLGDSAWLWARPGVGLGAEFPAGATLKAGDFLLSLQGNALLGRGMNMEGNDARILKWPWSVVGGASVEWRL